MDLDHRGRLSGANLRLTEPRVRPQHSPVIHRHQPSHRGERNGVCEVGGHLLAKGAAQHQPEQPVHRRRGGGDDREHGRDQAQIHVQPPSQGPRFV